MFMKKIKMRKSPLLRRMAVLATLMLFSVPIFAQVNIVDNYDFTDYSICPNQYEQIDRVMEWVNPDVTVPYPSTPDYFNSCCTQTAPISMHVGVPNNFFGYQPADAGDGYIALVTYYNDIYQSYSNYREYAQQELRCGLLDGIDYEVSFKVCLPNETVRWATSGIGMAFTNTNVQITNNTSPNFDYLALTPCIYANTPITDSVNWTRIAGVYTATGSEQYVYLGSFFNDSQIGFIEVDPNATSMNGGVNYASVYLVDSIRIRPLKLAWDDDTICEGDSVEICAYPCQGWSYYWTSIPNDPTVPPQCYNQCINVSPTQTTQYIVRVTDHYGTIEYDTVTIVVNSVDNINMSGGVYTGCKDVIEDSITNYNPAYNYSWGLSSSGSFTSITTNPFSIPWAASPNGGWIYFMTEDPATSCSVLDSIEVFPCCKNPDIYFWQDTVISSNTSWSGDDVYVDGYLIIDGCTVSCDHYNFYFNPNARVEIINGGYLSLEQVNLLACDTFYMWDGVYIEDDLSSFIADECSIKNAKNAVVSEGGGIYDITSTSFHDNYRGIVNDAYAANHTAFVSNCDFECTSLQNMYAPYLGVLSYSGIENHDVQKIIIGDSTLAVNDNEFENLTYGIYNENSNARILNNKFNLIEDKGIYSINTSSLHKIQIGDNNLGLFKANEFTDCNTAIYVDNNQNVKIINNVFTNNTLFAIHLRNHKRRKNIEVSNNTISGSIYGISMLDLWRSTINVHDNIIDGNAIGIVYNSIYNRRIWLKIIDNTISNAAYMGVQVVNAPDYTEIKQNSIDFTYNGGSTQYGIDVDNSTSVEIFNNIVTNQTASAGAIEGISVALSPEAWLCGNYTEDLMYGLSFEGSMPLTKIQTTQMQDCVNGMNFSNSYVGNQGSASQPWDNRWYQLANYRCVGSMSQIHDWYQRGGVYNPNISTSPPNGIIPYYYFINPYYTNPFSYISCEYIVSSLALGGAKDSELENIAEGLNTYSMLEEENEYREQLYLLRELEKMSKTKQSNELMGNLVLSPNYSNMASFEDYMDEIEAEDVLAATITNNSVSINNKMEEVMKEVNSIYLNSWAIGRYALETWEYDRLYEIACLEPMVYGEGVYTARVMTDYILTTIKKTRQSEQENVAEDAVCGDIYPNPAQQTASIDYNSEISSVLRVINLSGQEVVKYELQAGNYSFSFDVSRLPEGVYIYLLENNSSLIKYGKFVIIH
jgi:Secretion system C-terminal sorting domain/Periplasmic copper-binding protein (NosD)